MRSTKIFTFLSLVLMASCEKKMHLSENPVENRTVTMLPDNLVIDQGRVLVIS